MKRLILALPVLLLIAAELFSQQAARPKFPERSSDSLYQQLGVCNADLWDMRNYIQSLSQTLDARDKEIAELKAKLAEASKSAPPAPAPAPIIQ